LTFDPQTGIANPYRVKLELCWISEDEKFKCMDYEAKIALAEEQMKAPAVLYEKHVLVHKGTSNRGAFPERNKGKYLECLKNNGMWNYPVWTDKLEEAMEWPNKTEAGLYKYRQRLPGRVTPTRLCQPKK
jgi:hypothetical protein